MACNEPAQRPRSASARRLVAPLDKFGEVSAARPRTDRPDNRRCLRNPAQEVIGAVIAAVSVVLAEGKLLQLVGARLLLFFFQRTG